MTLVRGTDARCYVNQFDISTDLMALDPAPESQVQDVTTFGTNVTGRSYVVTLQTARVTADGFYSSDTLNGIDARMAPLKGGHVMLGVWPAGDAVGKRGYADDDALFTTWKVVAAVGQVVGVHAEWECSGGAELVTSLAARTSTAGAATVTGASADHGAASTNGGAAYFRLFGGTSSGTAVTAFRVEHSADNSTWATLASSALATTGTQRVAIAAGTTIERYTRAVVVVAAGKTAIHQVALQRA